MSESIFTKIINRQIPSDILEETEKFIAIKDIDPKAEIHILIIPKDSQYRNIVDLSKNPPLLAEFIQFGNSVADKYAGGQFRLVFNTGEKAGQTVFHLHGHILAAKDGLKESSL